MSGAFAVPPLRYVPPPMTRAAIVQSWQRSERAGLVPQDTIGEVEREFNPSSRLVATARPVLDVLAEEFRGLRAGGLLADNSATVVDAFFGDQDLATATEGIGARPGVVFDEENTGTNAIATCYETREPVEIHGAEHYLECMKTLSCYGVPIINPVTRRLEGILDLMMDSGIDTRVMHTVLTQTVRDITARMLADYDTDVLHSLAAFRALTRRTDDVVLLFGRDFVLQNNRTADVLSAVDLADLERLAGELRGRSTTVALELESGRVVGVESHVVGSIDASLLRVRDGGGGRPAVPRAIGRTLSSTERLSDRVAALAGQDGSLQRGGERGSGRSRTARQIAGPAATVLDSAELAGGVPVDLPDGPVVIEDVRSPGADPDVSPDARIDAVIGALARQRRRLIMTATGTATDSAALGYAGSLCPEWVELPPLRERLSDLSAITGEMLGRPEFTRGGRVRLSRPVLDVLRAHSWPGNCAELEMVLRHAVDRRSVGDIVVADLPARYQRPSPARTGLTPFESAELDLIERTLAAYNGNKVHTAKHLGISRSKLYSRMRYFQEAAAR